MRRGLQILPSDIDMPVMRAAMLPIDLDRIWEAPWPTTMVEKSGNVGIFYQSAMKNANTLNLCQALSITSEMHYQRMTGYFRAKGIPQLSLVVSSLSPNHDGTGGGYHVGDEGTHCFVDVKYDKSKKRYDPAFTSFAFIAEATEAFAWYNSRGWASDSDQGEALSRVMAITIMPGQLGPYGVAVKWLNSATRPDFTTQRVNLYLGRSIGCAMVFLFWARYKKRIPWENIIAAGKDLPNATIEDMWQKLTNTRNVFQQMQADINKTYPPGVQLPDDEEHEVLFK